VAPGWFVAGKTLGLALDLDAGTLRVSVDGGAWAVAFQDGCAPGAAAGAALFPALSGCDGARLRCNWGGDGGRPTRHAPPSGDYRAVGQLKVSPPPFLFSVTSPPPSSIAVVTLLHLWCPRAVGPCGPSRTRAVGACGR
jgi:hypothetical protein